MCNGGGGTSDIKNFCICKKRHDSFDKPKESMDFNRQNEVTTGGSEGCKGKIGNETSKRGRRFSLVVLEGDSNHYQKSSTT